MSTTNVTLIAATASPISGTGVFYDCEMPPATQEDQFKFLISCIRWSSNGRVDFTEVAHECGVVSKGAAAKRYERMMRANGIHPSGSGPVPITPPSNGRTSTPNARQQKVPRLAGPTPTRKPRTPKKKAKGMQDELDHPMDDEEDDGDHHSGGTRSSIDKGKNIKREKPDQLMSGSPKERHIGMAAHGNQNPNDAGQLSAVASSGGGPPQPNVKKESSEGGDDGNRSPHHSPNGSSYPAQPASSGYNMASGHGNIFASVPVFTQQQQSPQESGIGFRTDSMQRAANYSMGYPMSNMASGMSYDNNGDSYGGQQVHNPYNGYNSMSPFSQPQQRSQYSPMSNMGYSNNGMGSMNSNAGSNGFDFNAYTPRHYPNTLLQHQTFTSSPQQHYTQMLTAPAPAPAPDAMQMQQGPTSFAGQREMQDQEMNVGGNEQTGGEQVQEGGQGGQGEANGSPIQSQVMERMDQVLIID